MSGESAEHRRLAPSTTETAEDEGTAGVTCVNRLFEANYFVPRDLWKHPDHQRNPTLNYTFSD